MKTITGLTGMVLCVLLAGCGAAEDERRDADTPFSTELRCGQLPIRVQGKGESLQLEIGGEQRQLQQAVSASGARYVQRQDGEGAAEGEEQEQTSLWFKGDQASLLLDGVEYPLCVPPGSLIEPFRASGNEPFWSLRAEQGQLELNRLNQGELPAQTWQAGDDEGEYLTRDEPPIRLQLRDEICRDDMSGMPYPQRVRVEIEGEQLLGCGGDPARLLQGGEWVVEDILGGGIIDRSRVTLRFWQDGRLTGRASCNNLMGQYQLSGEGLAIGQAATTRMACSPALMEQEQRVLNSLAQVQRFDIDDTGALLLYTSEGALKARLEH